MMRKITLIALFIFSAVFLFSAGDVNIGGNFNVVLQKTGTDSYGFCTYETASSNTHDSLSSIDFELIASRDQTRTTTKFGVYWDLYTENQAENIELILAFSATNDNLSPYMLIADDGNVHSYLNYDVAVDEYEGDSEKPSSLTVVPAERDSSMSTSREIRLLDLENLAPYSGTNGYAAITLTLNSPVDSETLANEPFHEGKYTGYVLLYCISG